MAPKHPLYPLVYCQHRVVQLAEGLGQSGEIAAEIALSADARVCLFESRLPHKISNAS